MSNAKEPSYAVSRNLAAGSLAGAISKTFVAPLERTRMLKQTGASQGTILQTISTIVRNEGILGLWRGNVVNMVRIIPARGVLFASNDIYKDLLKDRFPTTDDPENTPFWMLFSSGGLAGMTSIIATYPLDCARTRLAGRLVTDKSAVWSAKSTSVLLCLKTMAKEEGIRSWYRGIGPTLLGALPYEGIKFSVYGFTTKHMFDKNSIHGKLASGAIAGCMAGFVMFPNDTVRKLMQIGPAPGEPPFRNAVECWVRTYRAAGAKRFYRGVFPYMLRIAPGSAIQFTVYESLKTR